MNARTVVAVALVAVMIVGSANLLAHGAQSAAPAGPIAPAVVGGHPNFPTQAPARAGDPFVRSHSASPPPPIVPTLVVIAPDGTVTPSGILSVLGTTYTLTVPLFGAIVDEQNNSYLYGNGFSIDGNVPYGFAIEVGNVTNVTVSNFWIGNISVGVSVLNSSAVTVEYNTIETVGAVGIQVAYGDYDGTYFNYVPDVPTGIDFSYTFGSGSEGDNVTLCGTGVDVVLSVFSEVEGISATYAAVGVEGSEDDGFYVDYDNLSYSTTPVEVIESSYVEVSEDTALGTSGAIVELSSEVTVDDSNFSLGITGLILTLDTWVDVYDNQMSAEIQNGTLADLVTEATYSGNVAVYDSGGFAILNSTYANLTDNDASFFVNNGLKVANSADIDSYDNTYSFGTGAEPNGTLVIGSNAVNLTGDTDTEDLTGVQDYGSQNLLLNNTNLSADFTGADLVRDTGATVLNCTADDIEAGVVALATIDTTVASSRVNATDEGIVGEVAIGMIVEDNSIVSLGGYGVFFLESIDASAYANFVNFTPIGIVFSEGSDDFAEGDLVQNSSMYGIAAAECTSCEFFGENVTNSAGAFASIDNTETYFVASWFLNDQSAFMVTGGEGNFVYWNTFLNTGPWSYDTTSAVNSTYFDDGYPWGGNFWSNDTGPDAFSGPGQNLSGRDGIVDHPLDITANGAVEDHYPIAFRSSGYGGIAVEFNETGLTGGAVWGLAVSSFGETYYTNTTGSSLDFYSDGAAWTTINYTLYSPAGWTPNAMAGSVHFVGSTIVVDIVFTAVVYDVTFTSSGLAAGASWSVIVDGLTHTTTASTLTLALANGTYNYSVLAVPGYGNSPSSGTVKVNGTSANVNVAYTSVKYTTTVSESGLPTGTAWSVTVGGTTESPTSSSQTFSLANGTYAYSVANVSGYTVTPASGSIVLSGGSVSVTVVFTKNGSTTSTSSSGFTSAPLFWALLAAVIVLAILVAVLAMRGRPKPAEAAPPAAWTPGAASAPPAGAATPPPPGPSVPPGAGGGSPNWKET
jgi:hypothetical protein